ncbi:DUF7504 family protein [Haloglomus irregulare]|uniref:DUF7504 family protein n=1 Tax=Haloglomus irregulare TaxID=2234134 RepID=UPI00118494FC|nr:hypothetical protein [Haloglomus irregulare]
MLHQAVDTGGVGRGEVGGEEQSLRRLSAQGGLALFVGESSPAHATASSRLHARTPEEDHHLFVSPARTLPSVKHHVDAVPEGASVRVVRTSRGPDHDGRFDGIPTRAAVDQVNGSLRALGAAVSDAMEIIASRDAGRPVVCLRDVTSLTDDRFELERFLLELRVAALSTNAVVHAHLPVAPDHEWLDGLRDLADATCYIEDGLPPLGEWELKEGTAEASDAGTASGSV